MKKRLMIVGPNGAGKTKMAYQLARLGGGEVINLDRTYLYRDFPITTGLQDTLKEQKDVPRHLYEVLDPETPSYSVPDFLSHVEEKCIDILTRGRLAIAEGASTVYVPALLELNSKRKIFDHIIGVRFPQNFDVENKYRRRIDQAFADGLIEEIKNNFVNYQNSYLIKECHSAIPAVRHISGKISLSEAKDEILKRCLGYKDLQMHIFSLYPEIEWMDAEDHSQLKILKSLGF